MTDYIPINQNKKTNIFESEEVLFVIFILIKIFLTIMYKNL